MRRPDEMDRALARMAQEQGPGTPNVDCTRCLHLIHQPRPTQPRRLVCELAGEHGVIWFRYYPSCGAYEVPS